MRSPAENYLKYLASHVYLTEAQVIEEAARLYLPPIPRGEAYIVRLRKAMNFPSDFDPRNPGHTKSMHLLAREGIYTMWFRDAITEKALGIQGTPFIREFMMAVLMTPMDLEKISNFFIERHRIDLPAEAIERFRHYFWNLKLLTEGDKTALMHLPNVGELMKTAARIYKDGLGPSTLLWQMGYLPTQISREEIFGTMRNIAYFNAIDVDRRMDQGRHKAAAFRDYFEVVHRAQDKLDESEAREKEIIERFYQQISVVNRKFAPPSADEMGIEITEASFELPQGSGEDAGVIDGTAEDSE